MKNHKPDVGTKMYFVQENLYYIKEKAAPILEYCVCEAEATGFFRGGYAELAKKITDEYEHTWGWLGEPYIPLRRTWEQYF